MDSLQEICPAKKRIVLFFFANRRHRAVPGTNNRFVRQSQNFLEIVFDRVLVGNTSAAHRAGEKRIAHNRDRPRETVHHKSHAARGMTPGQARFDFQFADAENFFLPR